MRPTTLGFLAAAAAISVGAALYLAPTGDAPEFRSGERIFPELATRAAEVRSVELQRPNGPVVIQHDGEVWRVPELVGYPADTAKVRQLFFEVAELRTLEPKTRNKDLYASLEVEDRDAKDAKSTRVAFKDVQGREIVALLAGKNRFGRGGGGEDAVYVRRAGDPQAWLAKGRLTVNRDPLHWLDRELTNVARERVREVVIEHADGSRTVVSRGSPGDRDFAVAAVPEGRKTKSSWEVNGVGGAFERLELDDVRRAADVPMPADAPKTVLTTYDGLQLTARFAEVDGTSWVAIAAAAEPPAELPQGATGLKAGDEVRAEAAAINAKLAPWVYKLPTYNRDNMRRKVEDLLEPNAS